MKLLLVSDTHGHLHLLNDLARKHSVDAVIHAGDFGFYDDASVDRLTERELKLRISHSPLPLAEKKEVLSSHLEDLRKFVRKHLPLSDLIEFLSDDLKFETPVYAVWGNHEDLEVVKRFHCGDYAVKGLHLLHDQQTYHLEDIHLFGLGGNCLIGKKFFQLPIAGGGGRVWSTFSQYLGLLEVVQGNAQAGERRLFVSHVSSGREAFITLMGIHLAADWIISGHMGPPLPMIWDEFAIRTSSEAVQRVKQSIADIQLALEDAHPKDEERYHDRLTALEDPQWNCVHTQRGQNVPNFCFNMFNVNLPDLKAGYALLKVNGDRWSIQSYGEVLFK